MYLEGTFRHGTFNTPGICWCELEDRESGPEWVRQKEKRQEAPGQRAETRYGALSYFGHSASQNGHLQSPIYLVLRYYEHPYATSRSRVSWFIIPD